MLHGHAPSLPRAFTATRLHCHAPSLPRAFTATRLHCHAPSLPRAFQHLVSPAECLVECAQPHAKHRSRLPRSCALLAKLATDAGRRRDFDSCTTRLKYSTRRVAGRGCGVKIGRGAGSCLAVVNCGEGRRVPGCGSLTTRRETPSVRSS